MVVTRAMQDSTLSRFCKYLFITCTVLLVYAISLIPQINDDQQRHILLLAQSCERCIQTSSFRSIFITTIFYLLFRKLVLIQTGARAHLLINFLHDSTANAALSNNGKMKSFKHRRHRAQPRKLSRGTLK